MNPRAARGRRRRAAAKMAVVVMVAPGRRRGPPRRAAMVTDASCVVCDWCVLWRDESECQVYVGAFECARGVEGKEGQAREIGGGGGHHGGAERRKEGTRQGEGRHILPKECWKHRQRPPQQACTSKARQERAALVLRCCSLFCST